MLKRIRTTVTAKNVNGDIRALIALIVFLLGLIARVVNFLLNKLENSGAARVAVDVSRNPYAATMFALFFAGIIAAAGLLSSIS